MRFFLLLTFAGAALAQTIITVHNAATLSAGVPPAVAPGSIILIQQMRGNSIPIGVDASRIAVRVRPQPAGAEMTAPVLTVGLGSLLALLPKDVPAGAAEVTLIVDGQASMPAQVQVAPVAAGLFTNAYGTVGAAIAQNVLPDSSIEVNGLLAPAVPGDYVVFWGTGLGETQPGDVTVEIGGKAIVPAYAGPAPGLPGVDQINVAVPADTPEGCYVSVLLRTPDSVSNEVTLARASQRGPCPHPLGLSEAQLRELDANRNARVVLASLRSEVMPPAGPQTQPFTYTRNGAASIEFALRNPLDVLLISQPLLIDEAYYSCRLQNSVAIPRFQVVDPFDAGLVVNVSGPEDKSLEARNELVPIVYVHFLEPPEPKADPSDLPPPFFSAGVWTFSGPGGSDVAPFQTQLTVPPTIRVVNRDQLETIHRSTDQIISWQAEGYTDRDVMTVTLTSRFPSPGMRANSVVCRAPATSGQLTIPAALLQQIPATPGISMLAGTLELRLASHPYRRKIVELPLTSGGTEKMVLDYLHRELLAATIR